MLCIHDKKIADISDGENNFINDHKSGWAITKTLNITLIPLIYKHQVEIDYCGSSAILIGMFLPIGFFNHIMIKILFQQNSLHHREYIMNWSEHYMNTKVYQLLNEEDPEIFQDRSTVPIARRIFGTMINQQYEITWELIQSSWIAKTINHSVVRQCQPYQLRF